VGEHRPELALRALSLELELPGALRREEFFVHYQPKVDPTTGRVIGLEVLIRWRHSELGIISPSNFIPAAEKSGFIVPLGEWVLRKACSQTKAWQAQGLAPVHIGVNVSPVQLGEENFASEVRHILAETGLAPEYLHLELTERVEIPNDKLATRIMSELRDSGVHTVADNFGAGYSSLSRLETLPLSGLKMHHSFLKGLPEETSSSSKFIRALLAFSRSRRLEFVAQGVETAEQRAWLESQGCDRLQGYLFSKPLTAEELARWLREGAMLPAEGRT
jgi:EAL domain-containing protein (putative c-di-GMP-specific phosphodiesterase class I)